MAAVRIDVCICTYQRSSSLQALLHSLAAQQDAPAFRVLLVDNNPLPQEQQVATTLASQLRLPLDYVHAPAANIALARNACLEHARAELLAFVDDDQLAHPHWLARLNTCLHNHDVVFGPVRARHAANSPRWLRLGGFHDKQVSTGRDGKVCGNSGYTANVLLRRACLGTLQFDLELGQSGGEDTVFFACLEARAARLGFCADALMEEPVDPRRCRLGWLWRRSYGAGQAHVQALRACGRLRWSLLPLAGLKVLYCTLLLPAALLRADGIRWRRQTLRAGLHLGVMAAVLGLPGLRLYGNRSEEA